MKRPAVLPFLANTILLAVLLALALPRQVAAQRAAVQGIVTNAATGQPLEGADVILQLQGNDVRTTTTDRNGFYQIGALDPATYTLTVQLFGFTPSNQFLPLGAGIVLSNSIRLSIDPLRLQGLVVTPTGGAIRRELGRQRITPGELRLVPLPAGSGDLASYLQTLPGVVTTGDRGGQLFIRGGTPSENLAMVDGMVIYQPFHVVGFFSAFPEDLVSSVDFYPSGFGARYNGRTSSVIDVQMRDGNPTAHILKGSVGTFLAEGLAEGPLTGNVSYLVSGRRSVVEETSPTILRRDQPLSFESQFVKFSTVQDDGGRCSITGLRTADEGRMDPEDRLSRVNWKNHVLSGRCLLLFESGLRLLEVSFGYAKLDNTAVTRGASEFFSNVRRLQHEVHATTLIGALPLYAGYQTYMEGVTYDLTDLFGLSSRLEAKQGINAYAETELKSGNKLTARPGLVFTMLPIFGVEPRFRASWRPWGSTDREFSGALGLYRQDLVGVSDTRDVGSVFVAWTRPRTNIPIRALHGTFGYQQSFNSGLGVSLEGYYKRVENVPVPEWRAVTVYNTVLSQADGNTFGADARIGYTGEAVRVFVGYGYGNTEYASAQDNFGTWFGEPIQHYHPPHDRRHQLNAMVNTSVKGFGLGARWQLGTGLPYTRPLGFDEAFNFQGNLEDVRTFGQTRLLLDKPYLGRLPAMHRLDLSAGRFVETRWGTLQLSGGVINAYGRRNIFYYDLYTGRRVDQLGFTPYLTLTLEKP